MNLKTGAWILSLVAIASLFVIAFGTETGCGFIALGLIVTLALGWDNKNEAR